MQQRFSANQVADAVAYFEANGYAVFRDVVSPCMGEAFWSDVEDNVRHNPDLRFSVHSKLMRQAELPEELQIALPRIIDIQGYVPLTAHLMLCHPVADFLVTVFGSPIACLQTLTYKFSSEQGAHSDKHLVCPPYVGEYARDTLAAAWFAFEASNKVNGALVIYPGSHKVQKKRLDADFNGDYGAYVNYLDGLCRDAGCPSENYEACPGEVLIWHGDLVHAGGPVMQRSPRPTRKSLVCHYAVVPEDRPSLLPDWVRMKCARGSYYVPSTVLGPQGDEASTECDNSDQGSQFNAREGILGSARKAFEAESASEFKANEPQQRGQPYALDVPGAALRGHSGVSDLAFWYAIGEAYAQIAMRFCMTDSPRVLDIGCGGGKMARFFVMNPRAQFIGLDIFAPAIEWCSEAFRAWPNFEFRHLDVHSEVNNPTGRQRPENARLPVASGSVDLVLCGSLFTHLLEPAFRRYLAEIKRLLRPPMLPGMRRGRALVSIHDAPTDGRFTGDEARIDISGETFGEFVAASGLRIVKHVGNVFGQEVFVLERRWHHG